MKQITLNGIQYLTLQALGRAASTDRGRLSLNRIFYDHPNDRFVATDGHMLRVERINWECEPPEESFLLPRSQVMLSRSQIKLQHGDAKNSEQPLQDIFITLDYDDEYGKDPQMVYPNYGNVIPAVAESNPIPFIGFNPWLLARICKTFYLAPRALQFRFFGELRTVMMFKGGEDENSCDFAGIVMPVRLPWEESQKPGVAA